MNEEKAGFGLSMLADAVTPDHYPVKRRGERRRLNPNWAGIAHLEKATLTATGIANVLDMTTDEGEWYSLLVSHGWRVAKARGNYARPMIEVMSDGASSTMRVHVAEPCPVCDDFAYTGRHCSGHPETNPFRPPERNLTADDSRPRALAAFWAMAGSNVEVSWRVSGS